MFVVSGKSVETGRCVRISVDKGIIKALDELEDDDSLPYVSPGFFDTQVNGYGGIDYSSEKLSPDDIPGVVSMLERTGTLFHFPTIITSSGEKILKNLTVIAEAAEASNAVNEAIPGIHVEGPYISAEDGPRGAHDPDSVRNPDYAEFEAWQEASGGRIRQLTLAPELPGALGFIEKAAASGVVVSIGHTAAEPSLISEAVDAGAEMSTHLGNGSHALIPRLKNYLWEQLADDRLWCSFIGDGFHLPSSVVKVFFRVKGASRMLLVSDVASLGGTSPGLYKWGPVDVEVHSDGHIGLAGTGYLAGSGHLLDTALAWLLNNPDLDMSEIFRLCTVNPVIKFFSGSSSPGIRAGYPADLVLFDWKRGDRKLNIRKVYRNGTEVSLTT